MNRVRMKIMIHIVAIRAISIKNLPYNRSQNSNFMHEKIIKFSGKQMKYDQHIRNEYLISYLHS